MQTKFSKYQKRILSALSSTRSSPETYSTTPSWCFSCDINIQPGMCITIRSGVICPYCRQQTLIPERDDLSNLRDSLMEFSNWLFEEIPNPDPRTPTKLKPLTQKPMTPKRMLQDELSKNGISIRKTSSKRDRATLGKWYLFNKSKQQLIQTNYDLPYEIEKFMQQQSQ